MGTARMYLNGVLVGTGETHRDEQGVLVVSSFDALPEAPHPWLAGDMPPMSWSFRRDDPDGAEWYRWPPAGETSLTFTVDLDAEHETRLREFIDAVEQRERDERWRDAIEARDQRS